MENPISGWKKLMLLTYDPDPPSAWGRAGFHGFPGGIPVSDKRRHGRARCPITYRSGQLTWEGSPTTLDESRSFEATFGRGEP
jgi:hypothetical protein